MVREELIEGILERNAETTILIASHDLSEIESFASHFAYLEQGRLKFAEDMASISDRFRQVEITLESARNLRSGTMAQVAREGLLYQILILDQTDFDRLRGQRVTITGRMGASIVRMKDMGSLSIGADSQPISGLGRCSTRVEDSLWDSSFKVVCESTTAIPRGVSTTVIHSSGREWRGTLGESMPFFRYPRETWLSPLDRQQAYYRMIDYDPSGRPGQQWLLPRSMIEGATVRLRSIETLGYTHLNFELRDVDLEKFEASLPR